MPSLLSVLRQQIAAVLTATLPLKQMHPSVGTFTAKGECSRKRSHLALLRSALLILKLASLTADMDLKYVPPALLAPKAIWSALGTIADNAGRFTDPADQDKAGVDDEQRLHLSVPLVKLTMPALRRLLSQEADESSSCCNLLLALMANASSAVFGAVASELL